MPTTTEGVPPDTRASRPGELGRAHAVVAPRGDHFLHRRDVEELRRRIQIARARCVEAGSSSASARLAADWLLDNDFLIRGILAQLRQELPAGFQRRLPLLRATGEVRVLELARALYRESLGEIELDAMERFLSDYQQAAPLTIAELWALPAMLRLAILSDLLRKLESIDAGQASPAWEGTGTAAGRAVRSLKILMEVHWKQVFSRVSVTDQLLSSDPAGVYSRMDFETRDRYRSAVEEIATAGKLSEMGVAGAALRRAAASGAEDPAGHVGFHLVGEGRRDLEAALGARARSAERMVLDHPRAVFFGLLVSIQLLFMLPVAAYLVWTGASPLMLVLGLACWWIPASVPTSNVVRWILARIVRPKPLPKLDFSGGIPAPWRTLVAVPTLLGDEDQIERTVERLELHFLANRDPELRFALLTDHPDSAGPMDGDTESERAGRLEHAASCVRRLNQRHGADGRWPFHLLHREPRWNPVERKWMGWERKRGKIEELNRYLRGEGDTSYVLHAGKPEGLRGVAFVLTLDSDTQLPAGAAARLAGTLAHPLGRPVVDGDGSVVSGYSVLQPRVEVSPGSAVRSAFSRRFSGETGIDIYTRAVSETYQDLFGEGIYVGKGIYDVDAFRASLENRVPENALLSHDLFEGLHGRAALVTDVVVYEDYPARYPVYLARLHRWVRGDWQLLPWLFPRVPVATGHRAPNRLGVVDRFKIVDNMRRSVVWASTVALLVAGWTFLPGDPWFWTAAALLASGAAALAAWVQPGSRAREESGRWLLGLCLAPIEAVTSLDAIVRVLVRMAFTGRKLLEWTTVEEAAKRLEDAGRIGYLAHLWTGPTVAVSIAVAVTATSAGALPWAAPILVLWVLSPEIAWRVSRPTAGAERDLSTEDVQRLRLVARRTWLFFETFVGPADNWLPIDHFQEWPRGAAAHRTSPTNIGMLLVSQLAAYDLGYIGRGALASWASNTLDALERLERFRGHIYNWYDTRTLEPLEPRYVSTVDSGNLAGALLTLAVGCDQAAAESPDHARRLRVGLHDTARLLREAVRLWTPGREPGADHDPHLLTPSLAEEVDGLVTLLAAEGSEGRGWLTGIQVRVRRIGSGLLLALRDASAATLDPSALRELRLWLAALDRQAADAAREESAAGDGMPLAAPAAADRLRSVARRARALVDRMDFAFLYDPAPRFFRIGYNVTADRADTHHYDLLASEARLASFLAVTRGEAPLDHWFALGRPLVAGPHGEATLLSWGGSMFEYLMPRLFMRSHRNTLLYSSYEGSVDRQIEYARGRGIAWGISESGYALLDGLEQYQYRAFGVPGLGLRRGLEEDVVVAPYASFLALSVRPSEVIANLEHLEDLGASGPFGFYEAVDFHPRRARGGRPAVVRSYMAHHHGMSLAAIANVVTDDAMVRRFHADPIVRSGELLLDEQVPPEVPKAGRDSQTPEAMTETGVAPQPLPSWAPELDSPAVWAVGNGSLTSFVTAGGAGGLRRRDTSVSRWDADPVSESHCRRVYVCDRESGDVLGLAPDPARAVEQDALVVFEAGHVELRHRQDGLSIRLRVTVTPSDDVEIQEIEIANEGRRRRTLSVIGCLEPLLAGRHEGERHPAFSKMFVRCAPLHDMAGVLITAVGRGPLDAPSVAFRMTAGDEVTPYVLTVDRARFLGRNGDVRRPAALLAGRRAGLASTIDPLCACAADLVIDPGERRAVAVITAVADRSSEATELALRFGSVAAARWAFEDSDRAAARRLERLGVPPLILPAAQRLLSALLVPEGAWRAPEAVLEAGRPAQRKLWGRGISGDEPIVWVGFDRTGVLDVLADALAAHRYLSWLGVRVDLVLVDRAPTSYGDDDLQELRRFLERHEAADLLGRRGGVHLIHADQAAEAELADLAAAALVYVDAADGSLRGRLEARPPRPAELPRHEPVTPPGAVAEAARAAVDVPALALDNGLGGFADDDYVIRPGARPPAPWCNVIANPLLGCLVSESSFGSTWCLNAGENRLTPWRNDPVLDTPSEVLYLRDEETGRVWSATPAPAGPPAVVRHGQGYSRFQSGTAGLEHELTVFVPPDDPVKVVTFEVRNHTSRPRRITATYYAEWVLGPRRSITRPFVRSDVVTGDSCLLAETSWSVDFGGRVAFLASDRPLHGFTTDRVEMLGAQGGLRAPAGLRRVGLSGRVGPGLDPCAALQVHLDLEPAGRARVTYLLGQEADRDRALGLVRRMREPGAVGLAWEACRVHWEGLLGAVRFETPDPALDRIANRWLPYQTISSRFFGRTAFYQSSGAFGFRDQLQDSLLFLHSDPSLTRAHLLECAARQFTEGDVLHWWHPPSGAGVRTRCSDDLLWLVFVTSQYVRATGDTDVLQERVPFIVADPLTPSERTRFATFAQGEAASLLEHCRRALARGATVGPHGLPLIGDGDWNDGMDAVGREGRGESIWLGWFLHACIEDFAETLGRIGAHDEARAWLGRLPTLRTALDEHGWDGQWYKRAFYDDGTPIGSREGEPPHIDSIAQSWAVLSRAAPPARARTAIASAEEHLVHPEEQLVLLLTPPFGPHGHDPGYIAAYPPGIRENGGQYTHAAAWLGLAYAMLGDGASAHRIVELLNPLERTKTPEGVERYAVEPYVMAADVYGMPPFVGRGGWTWYTGAAAWVWRLTVEGILGLTRRDGALHVDPCIPPTWPGFEAWVRAGELTVHVRVHNDGPGRHVSEATLDGVTIPEARVGLTGAGARRLEVWLGRPGRPRPIDERGGVEAREGSGRAP